MLMARRGESAINGVTRAQAKARGDMRRRRRRQLKMSASRYKIR